MLPAAVILRERQPDLARRPEDLFELWRSVDAGPVAGRAHILDRLQNEIKSLLDVDDLLALLERKPAPSGHHLQLVNA